MMSPFFSKQSRRARCAASVLASRRSPMTSSVLELASDTDQQLSTTDIAERHGISTHHLAKVMRNLVHEGLVQAVRGAGGGYRFSGNVKRTTLLDVIQLFFQERQHIF